MASISGADSPQRLRVPVDGVASCARPAVPTRRPAFPRGRHRGRLGPVLRDATARPTRVRVRRQSRARRAGRHRRGPRARPAARQPDRRVQVGTGRRAAAAVGDGESGRAPPARLLPLVPGAARHPRSAQGLAVELRHTRRVHRPEPLGRRVLRTSIARSWRCSSSTWSRSARRRWSPVMNCTSAV